MAMAAASAVRSGLDCVVAAAAARIIRAEDADDVLERRGRSAAGNANGDGSGTCGESIGADGFKVHLVAAVDSFTAEGVVGSFHVVKFREAL
jgi:hypothetical protein